MQPYPPIAELLPHRGASVLLDAVLEDHAGGLRARVTIRSDHPYLVPGRGIPAWVGIELMAQAAAAHAGLKARSSQMPPNGGMLLGTRRFEALEPWFREGMELEVSAEQEFGESGEGGVSACVCAIRSGGRTLATATLVVLEIIGGKMP
jgi:predicted hotdog family 3-hydroxylacyl-ACP dehydratase